MIKNCIRIATLKFLTTVIPVGVYAQGMYIGSGTHVVANGNVNIILKNASLITNGNFTAGQSNVAFFGVDIADATLIGGTTPVSFYNVIINRPSKQVTLNGDITINGVLDMYYGTVQLNNHTLDLTTTGSIARENSSTRITGAGLLRKTANLNAPQDKNPGNIGVAITSAVNLGQTVITRTHVPPVLPNGITGIQRAFSIIPANNSATPLAIKFYFLPEELNGITDEKSLSVWSLSGAGNSWVDIGKESMDTTLRFVTKSGPINQFTNCTLAPAQTTQLLRVNNNVTTKASATDQLPDDLSSAQTSARVYPNPVQQQFLVALVSSEEKEYVISLYNQYGQLLQSKKPLCRKGMNQIYWNMSDYANGVYFVAFENDGLKSIKIIKQ